MNQSIVEKIKKLLALSKSGNEHEAEMSMLKAQELLAKYKLSIKEVEDFKVKSSNVQAKKSDITFTSAKWKGQLSFIIADNFGCYCYLSTYRTHLIVFLGREEDVNICNIVMRYAVDCIESGAGKIKYKYVKAGYSTRGIVNDYAAGFIYGLNSKFEEQKKANKEWGLVLMKDQDVSEAYNSIKFKGSINTNTAFRGNFDIYEEGIKDGKKFSISDKIADDDTEAAALSDT